MGALACFQEADKRRRAMSRPAVVALFLVCGLLAMNVMAEANDELFEEDVLVEEAAAPAKAATSTESSRARTWESRELDSGDATKQLSATASDQAAQQKKQFAKIAEQQKQALVKRHEINKVARKEMRKAATTSAKNSLNQAISGLTAHVKKMAARAAKLAAKSISKHTKFNHNNAAAERKMKMLEKDVVLLLAAKKKAIHEALISKQSYEKKAQRYKAAVLAKVKRAEGDIQTIQNKLAGFKVAKARERITEARMHKIAQNVVKQTVSLKSKQQRVARLNQQHITALKKEKKTAIKAKKSLKQLVGHYKQKLEVLKSTLKKLRKSPEIGKAKMVRHAKALRLQSTNISRLKRSLKHAEKNTKVLQIAASKRESVLRVANKAYVNLSGAVSRLKAMAITQKSVRLKAPKGSLTATATKTKSAIKTAIKDVAKTSKIAFRKAIIAAAEKAASSEANNQDTHQMTRESSKAVEVQPFDETDFASEDEATSLSQAQLDKAAQRLLHGAI